MLNRWLHQHQRSAVAVQNVHCTHSLALFSFLCRNPAHSLQCLSSSCGELWTEAIAYVNISDVCVKYLLVYKIRNNFILALTKSLMLTLPAGTTLLYCSKEEAALWLSVYTVFFECCTAATCSVAVQLQLCIWCMRSCHLGNHRWCREWVNWWILLIGN